MSTFADHVQVSSPTEEMNAATVQMDQVSTIEMLQMMNVQDSMVAGAVAQVLPRLAELVDQAVARVRAGGRVHYFGAGTSGRLGVLDAAELPPTFGIGDNVVVAHQAGGPRALVRAVENAEDDETSGSVDAGAINSGDVLLGLTASGRTPYVHAALRAGREIGAATALISSNPMAPLISLADFVLITDTGPEAITGSTRLKAGSALKFVLNSFSSALMVRLGHTYQNLMVDMRPTNAKLRGRSIRVLQDATGLSSSVCEDALNLCHDIKTSVVFLLDSAPRVQNASADDRVAQARAALRASDGHVRQALALRLG